MDGILSVLPRFVKSSPHLEDSIPIIDVCVCTTMWLCLCGSDTIDYEKDRMVAIQEMEHRFLLGTNNNSDKQENMVSGSHSFTGATTAS